MILQMEVYQGGRWWFRGEGCCTGFQKTFLEQRDELTLFVSLKEESFVECLQMVGAIFRFTAKCIDAVDHTIHKSSEDTRRVGRMRWDAQIKVQFLLKKFCRDAKIVV